MRRVIGCLGLALALALLPALAAQEKEAKPADKGKDKADKNSPKDKKEALDKQVTGGQVLGKVTQYDAERNAFTLEVTLRYAVPNTGALNNIASWQVQLAQAAQRGDRNAVVDLQIKIAQEQRNVLQWKEERQNVEFQAADDMKVRLAQPPAQFDDKGRLRRATAKERDDLKGPNKSLPGYNGELSDLKSGSVVKVYLPKAKPGARSASGKAKAGDKSAPAPRLEAVMVVIYGDPNRP